MLQYRGIKTLHLELHHALLSRCKIRIVAGWPGLPGLHRLGGFFVLPKLSAENTLLLDAPD